MRWEIGKCIKVSNVDEDINLQKARRVRTNKNEHISTLKPR
jgi:hypothetical protein